jgi:hypothetical protein
MDVLMTDPIITCPSCKREIKLTESLAAPLLDSTRRQYEKIMAEKDSEVARRESAIREQQEAVAKAHLAIDQQVLEKLESERIKIAAEETKKARQFFSKDLEHKNQELIALQEIIKHRDEKLLEAQKAQAEFIRKERELEEAKREIDLTVEKKVRESLTGIREKAKQEAEDGLRLKVAEKEEIIQGMKRQIEQLQRKAERGSEQLHGEVLELQLEDVLRQQFPYDSIAPVPKGVHGGDVIQTVNDSSGVQSGIILWETKRTKNWNDAWLPKFRDDQREAKAHFAVLVSFELPKGLTTFDNIQGVWVTCPACALPLAQALRLGLLQLANHRRAADGKQSKMELLYDYLSGQEFRHRIEGMVECFITLKEDLESEKRAMQRAWSKREKQLERATSQAAGLYGDLSGLIGKALPAIDHLQLPEIELDEDHDSLFELEKRDAV